jgi:hypothetical protein
VTAATHDGSAWADGLDVPPPLTVSQWADRYRQLLPPVAEPGPSAIERSATPGGWPASVTLRAPDGTTRPLRHVGGGVYEQGED